MKCNECEKDFTTFRMAAHQKHCQGKKYCENCKQQLFSRNDRKFCSLKCVGEYQSNLAKKNRDACLFCHNIVPRGRKKFCNRLCIEEFEKSKEKSTISMYRTACAFDFVLSDYPEEFDFDLIKKYGWYSPSNKKNNLGGISRDHIMSVAYGFQNNIDPAIISHPANCRLMIHSENISKSAKSDMSLEELLLKIKKWNNKYGSLT